MNDLIQMIFQQKIKQIPQGMMNQLENQLKRLNPQAYQEFQQARKNNDNPNEYLSKVVDNFSPQKKEQWDSMMNQFGNSIKKQG